MKDKFETNLTVQDIHRQHSENQEHRQASEPWMSIKLSQNINRSTKHRSGEIGIN